MGRTARAGAALLSPGSLNQRICGSCLRSIQQVRQASTATAAATPTPEPTPDLFDQKNPSITTSTAPHQTYRIRAGVVLSRPPLITRDLTSFEKSFFLYQRRLNERLALNFSRYFYFPADTQSERDWKRKMRGRSTVARDIGDYAAHGREGWNDELLVGAQESETTKQVEALLNDAAVETEEEGQDDSVADGEKRVIRQEVERPQSRVTEADRTGDMKSLERALQRTLYLLVQNKDGSWEFPADSPVGKESLHRAAERLLVEGTGPNMNTWMIARHPIGWHRFNFDKPEQADDSKLERLGIKTFFLKGRIMAGQANVAQSKFGYKDFRWLAKEEVERQVAPTYWKAVKNMLVEL